MRKSRFTEEQIIKVLKEHAAGLSAGDVCPNVTTLRPANRCRMASSKASTADCATSVSTSTCSLTSRRRDRSSKNGGSTTTPTDRARASTGSHRQSSQHAPRRGKTGTDSPYERGQVGEQVTIEPAVLEFRSSPFRVLYKTTFNANERKQLDRISYLMIHKTP